MRVEAQADDFHFMALKCVVALARVGVPTLSLPVEGARDNFVSESSDKFEQFSRRKKRALASYPYGLLKAIV